jgi:hypothetical protein
MSLWSVTAMWIGKLVCEEVMASSEEEAKNVILRKNSDEPLCMKTLNKTMVFLIRQRDFFLQHRRTMPP